MAEVREGMSQEEEITEEEMVFTPRGKPVLGETSKMGTGLLVDAMSQITDQLRDVSERLRELEQLQQPSSRPDTLPINTVVSPPMSPTLDPTPSSVSVVPPQQTGCPYLAEVRADQTVPIVVECQSKVHRFIQSRTEVAQYEICSEPIIDPNLSVYRTQISNELVPHFDQTKGEGTRQERLQGLIDEQDWSHLNSEQRSKLSQVVLDHEGLFVLESQDLELIN
ncbi:hypothetical protein Pcinc_002410 [Petrolisthes cinctipes]|uniref:Uncharacterized protein n=1 Tax=Petrolisthes cinctipes TaxID=88211 RepID=A0AAE1L3H7_PETCI|nr:hypothetical protein Pcinc_002410 [Petrolisthes cinctipes]